MRLLLLILGIATYIFADLSTTVSILPQKYFVEKIGGDRVSVDVMVKPGDSPAVYEPTAKQMKDLSKSDIYFSIGVPFERRWLHRFKDVASNTSFVDVSKYIKRVPIAKHAHHGNEHVHEGEHHHGDGNEKPTALDPHIWLSPKLVKTIANNIYTELAKADKKNASYYKSNYENFLEEIDRLDRKIHKNLSNISSNEFIVFHPSWGYFARDYGLVQVAIEIEGKSPKQKELVELIELAKKRHIKAVFVAPEFSQKSAKLIAQSIDGKTITVSPLSPKWDSNLLLMSEKLRGVLE